jgi:hypothetical protein
MENINKTYNYKASDILKYDQDNPDTPILTIPQEILEQQGWKKGTELKISIGDQGTIILEEVKKTVDKAE